MNPVPDAYLGVWQRRLLTTTAGVRDESSDVFWLQGARLHADLRIPQPTPAPRALSIETCTHAEQQALAGHSGFAGLTEVEGERCQWHRLLDYQPARDQADVGRMRFEHSERLVEDALDGSYREIWHRLPESLGSNWGLWLQAASSARQGCLLVAGDYFLFAAERPCPLPPGGTLHERLAAVSPAERLQLLACELSFGRHRGGATPWRISHSTLPGRAGQALLPADCPHHDTEALPPAALLQLGRYSPDGGWIPVPAPVLSAPQETCP
jgi:hypothetical protein